MNNQIYVGLAVTNDKEPSNLKVVFERIGNLQKRGSTFGDKLRRLDHAGVFTLQSRSRIERGEGARESAPLPRLDFRLK